MPHRSSEHEEEQIESMVGGAAMELEEGPGVLGGRKREDAGADGMEQEEGADAPSPSDEQPKKRAKASSANLSATATIEEAINQMESSEEKTAAMALLQLLQEDEEFCVDFVLETNAKRDDPANLYYYWKDFCELVRLGFIGKYNDNKDVINPPPTTTPLPRKQVIIHGRKGFDLVDNPLMVEGEGGGGSDGGMLKRIVEKYLNVILEDETVTTNIDFFRQHGLPDGDDEASVILIEAYFGCYYLGKIRFAFTTNNTLSNQIMKHFSEDILVKAMTRYVTSFFNAYDQEISFLGLGEILNMVSETHYDWRIRIGLALFLLHLLKRFKTVIQTKARDVLDRASESVTRTIKYLEDNVHYYGEKIFEKKLAAARLLGTAANEMPDNRVKAYQAAQRVVNELIPNSTAPDVKEAVINSVIDLMEKQTFEDMKTQANIIMKISGKVFLDPHTRQSLRFIPPGAAASGGAPKRITKKHTNKGKTKMLKGKSKKHLKKAKKSKKGRKTGKKVRFHSASKKSKKTTRKRR